MNDLTITLSATDRQILIGGVLCTVMEFISEEEWRSGWHSGIERILWNQAQTDEPDGVRLRLLAILSGGWWRWGVDCPEFVPLDEWDANWRVALRYEGPA